MTDLAIAEHITYLVNDYKQRIHNYAAEVNNYNMLQSILDKPEYITPNPADSAAALLNRVEAVLENRQRIK